MPRVVFRNRLDPDVPKGPASSTITFPLGRMFIDGRFLGANAPNITSITGTTANGFTLTINGIGLHSQDTTNWHSFFTANSNRWSFEGASPTADGYVPVSGGSYTSSVKLFGAKCFTSGSLTRAAGGSCPQNNVEGYHYAPSIFTGSSTDAWIRAYGRWNYSTNWPNSHTKWLEAFNAEMYCQPANTASGLPPSSWLIGEFRSGSHSYTAAIPDGQLKMNRWYCVEVHIIGNPARVQCWINGTQTHDISPYGDGDLSAANELLFGIINACGTNGFTIQNWTDGMVVGSQRIWPACVVELADGSNYATATKRYQYPELISDSVVHCIYDDTGLGATGERWVFVTNNRRATSAGFQVV